MPASTPTLVRLLRRHFPEGDLVAGRRAAERLDALVAGATTGERRAAASEVTGLLGAGLCESQIRDLLLYEIGCGYDPDRDGREASGWLRSVRARLLEGA